MSKTRIVRTVIQTREIIRVHSGETMEGRCPLCGGETTKPNPETVLNVRRELAPPPGEVPMKTRDGE